MLGRPVLNAASLAAHRVGVPGQKDVNWMPLYDFQQYAAAGVLALTFFTAPIGNDTTSAPGAGTDKKTLFDTNLNNQGQLTKGNEFYAVRSETLFYPGVTNSTSTPFGLLPGRGSIALANVGMFVNDVYALSCAGLKTLTIGTDRIYIQDGPLAHFPPVTRLAIQSAIGVTNDSDSTATSVVEELQYAAFSGEPYSLVPIYIEDNQSFTLALTFPALTALPSGIAGRIGERLGGYRIRQAT